MKAESLPLGARLGTWRECPGEREQVVPIAPGLATPSQLPGTACFYAEKTQSPPKAQKDIWQMSFLCHGGYHCPILPPPQTPEPKRLWKILTLKAKSKAALLGPLAPLSMASLSQTPPLTFSLFLPHFHPVVNFPIPHSPTFMPSRAYEYVIPCIHLCVTGLKAARSTKNASDCALEKQEPPPRHPEKSLQCWQLPLWGEQRPALQRACRGAKRTVREKIWGGKWWSGLSCSLRGTT